MNETQLKFPQGDFTHSELAEANGQTNQQVWVRYQAAIKTGIIVSAGERKGKGKPSKLWKVASGQPVPLAPVPTPKPTLVEVVKTPLVGLNPKPEAGIGVVEIGRAIMETVPPIKTPVIAMLTAEVPPVEVKTVQTPAPKSIVLEDDTHEIDLLCPFCNHKLWSVTGQSGVTVWCSQPIAVCKSTENPNGFGKNDKAAYETLCEKFRHA